MYNKFKQITLSEVIKDAVILSTWQSVNLGITQISIFGFNAS